MADKNFALKNLTLIPTDGYSSIESDGTIEINTPNFVNLNADTVGVSTDITIGGQVSSDLIIGSGFYVGVGTTNPLSSVHVVGDIRTSRNLITTGNAIISGITTMGLTSSSTPPTNSQMSFALTSNTNLRISVRGTDGTVRTANITLA